MSGFRWIQISLFLIAVTGQKYFYTVRDGDDITLPCENGIQDDNTCDSTTWRFSYYTKTGVGESVRLKQAGDIRLNDRLSVTKDCSLLIKKATVEDVGVYTCRRSRSGKAADTLISLFVITSNSVDGDEDLETSQSECSVTVKFPASSLKQKSKSLESFKCEVRHALRKEEQQFAFSRQSSGENATTRSISTAAPPTTTTSAQVETEARTDCYVVNDIMLVLRVVELILITVITVLLIRAPGIQRPPDDTTFIMATQ